MSGPNLIRTIKLRSVENAVYTPSYNRVSFSVSEDDMSTDLSKSYLAMNLSLIDTTTKLPVTATQVNGWGSVGLSVSFGNDHTAYSSSCIIKTARLIAKGGGQILEEIQFSNVLSQTLYQLTHDAELAESMSILYATGQSSGMGSSFNAAIGALAFTVKNNVVEPLQVHIPLTDMFGVCKSTNFHLSQTKGLIFQFELEDNLNLFQYIPKASQQDPEVASNFNVMGELGFDDAGAPAATETRPPPNYVDGTMPQKLVWYPTPETQVLKPKLNIQPNDRRSIINVTHDGLRITNNQFMDSPQGLGPTYQGAFFDEPFWGTGALSYFGKAGEAVGDRTLRITAKLPPVGSGPSGVPTAPTEAQLSALGFNVGTILKVSWRVVDISVLANANSPIKQSGKKIEEFVTITAIGTDGVPTATIVTDSRLTFAMDLGAIYMPQLEAVEIMTQVNKQQMILSLDKELGLFDALVATNSIVMDAADLAPLIQLGAVIAAAPVNGVTTFSPGFGQIELAVSMERTATGVAATDGKLCVAPYVSNEGTNAAQLTSSGIIRLPSQGKGVKVVAVEGPVDGYYNVRFSDLGMTPLTNPLAKQVLSWTPTPQPYVDTYTPIAATRWKWAVFGATSTGVQPNGSDLLTPLSYSIDKFELILVQQSKSPRMPMTKLYSTYKMEPAAIESDQYQWQRQFIVNDGSCYNIALLTPDYTGSGLSLGKGSLVSRRRNISRYRWQVNNVDATNRDITIQDQRSDYPSSLHRDKLTDWFANSDMNLMTLEGITPLAMNPDPVSILPLKVYSGVIGSNYIVNPANYTAQLVCYGDSSLIRPIQKGPVFLWKFCIREVPSV